MFWVVEFFVFDIDSYLDLDREEVVVVLWFVFWGCKRFFGEGFGFGCLICWGYRWGYVLR